MPMGWEGNPITSRAASLTLRALLALLFAVAVWFRITSLEALPDIESDEAWYGVQAYHLGRGEPFSLRTLNGHPFNPFHGGVEVLLLLIFKPNYWILRTPAMLAGLLTIALTYVLGSRAFGRRTALIAAATVAVLPITITYSRKGYDNSLTPLMNFLLLYFTYRNNWKGMLVASVGSFLSHPTNVFLFPIVATVFVVRAYLRHGDEPRARRRLLVGTVLCGLVVLGCGLAVLSRPRTREIYDGIRIGGLSRGLVLDGTGGLSWGALAEFLTRYGKLCLSCSSFGLWPGPRHDWAFWSVFLTVLVLGTIQLARQRLWERLALVVGLFFGLAALFLAVGPEVIRPDTNRYGLFLVLPTVLAFAFLLDPLIVSPTTRLRAAALSVQCAALLALGGASLAAFKVSCFDANRGNSRAERVWTLRADEKDAKCRAWRVIERDRALAAVRRARAGQAPGPSKTILFVQDWWTWWTLEYLALPYKDIEVRSYYDHYQHDFRRFWADLSRALDEGSGYALCFKGQEIEQYLRERVPPERLTSWELVRYGNAPVPVMFSESVVVFRGKLPTDPDPPAARPMPPAPLTASRPVERK